MEEYNIVFYVHEHSSNVKQDGFTVERHQVAQYVLVCMWPWPSLDAPFRERERGNSIGPAEVNS